MRQKFSLLEVIFLLIGTGIPVHQLGTGATLDLPELGLTLFCYGYVISSVADREGNTGPGQFLSQVVAVIRAIRGMPDPPPDPPKQEKGGNE